MTTSSFTRPTRTDSTNVGRSPRPIPQLFEATATAAVVFGGLFAGMLLAVAVLESSMRGLAAPVYTQVRLIELDRLGGLATILLMPAIIATAALAWSAFRRRGAERWLTLTTLLLLLTAFAISVAINVPINTAQQGWSLAAPPSDWSGVRDRWQLAHIANTSTAVLAFVLLAAVTTSRRSRQGNATQAQPRERDNTMTTILVTGATGNVGRPLVTDLVDAGVTVRAVTRHPRQRRLARRRAAGDRSRR